ncbi:hypothetical protein HYALB_00004691 [Hymenoscyphus albidus]|uniref:FAD-binding FR-type domain-containing protein n=1 Tax=Hymenoscyphus albidus TaxID=595503 RepID=A0A9N9LRU5_9HELO|nr:hypothetical protein HYALB_00004691 [Hymenoscyphus albidus]
MNFNSTKSQILPYTKGLTGVNLWLNNITSEVLYASLVLIALLILILRAAEKGQAHLRFLSTLTLINDQQRYWKHSPGDFWPKVKRCLLTAPLFHKRHNKEIQISSTTNIGTLPSRFHAIFLAFYFLSNVVYCCLLDYNQPKAALFAEARGRTGHLAVVNMASLFIFAARNNPLVPILGIPFDTFNLLHRWVGRIVVFEALAHTFFWGANNYNAWGLHGLASHIRADLFLIYGLLAMVAMVTLLFQSISVIRHAFYESFLHLHQLLVVIILISILLHCTIQELPQKPFIYILISFWALERLTRLIRIFCRRGATVQIEALAGGACRVTFDVRGKWTKSPGCHIYAYIPGVSFWMSHPFSVAWVDDRAPSDLEPGDRNSSFTDTEADFKPVGKSKRSLVSCVIAKRTGMTAALYHQARQSPTGIIKLRAFVEGPYGGLENMRSYGTVVLFAGGVGITHQVSHVRDLVNGFADGTCSTRKVVLIWSVRSAEQLEWISPWLEELSTISKRGCELIVLQYVTRPSPDLDDSSEDLADKAEVMSEGVREVNHRKTFCIGRPNVVEILSRQFEERVGAMSVGVCGPGALADDVRAAARNLMGRGNVDFWEEAFTW